MKSKLKTKDLILIALFAALTAVLAQIVLPIGPVPFNLAVFGAFMAGVMLPPAAASTSMLVYLLLGAVGVPVFASFSSGLPTLLGKSGGYIFGYIVIAFLTAFAHKKNLKLPACIAFMALGLICCYTLGTAWFMVITGLDLAKSLVYCVIPFIIPDILKGAGALILGRAVNLRLAKVTTV